MRQYHRRLKLFYCEPYLMTPEIKEWIKERELEPFGENAYRKRFYYCVM
ncbi:MAG: hypothetical protein ACTSRT_06325 [Promethearchaeota archaeon]